MAERLTASRQIYGAAERVTVEEAMRAYTRDAAYAARVEDEVGTLAARQLADLVVLDADPTTVSPPTSQKSASSPPS